MKDFVDVKLTLNNLDNFFIRQSILENMKNAMSLFHGKLLDVGCGKMPYKSFILENSKVKSYTGLDIETAIEYDKDVSADIFWDGIEMPLKSNGYETVIATEVLEHCFEPEVVLKEINRVLKPGGTFFFTVPFLWNLHEVPNDAYRYTPFSLEKHLINSGFQDIKINATGGWHAAMAQMLGLWVRRSPMSKRKRKYLSIVLKPIVKMLLKKDSGTIAFNEGQMITGLFGIAKKQ